jgi:DNA polymerase V
MPNDSTSASGDKGANSRSRKKKRVTPKAKPKAARPLRLCPPASAKPPEPSPAANAVSSQLPPDYIEGRLDLNRYLIKHPTATFYVRVSGDSMSGAGINPGTILVVDRAVDAEDGDIIIARINDELTVKRLRIREGRTWLYPENERFQPVEVIETTDFEVWGRVMHAIRSY